MLLLRCGKETGDILNMSDLPNASIQALQILGFSELEAAIYTFLLQDSPVTGYRIAQALGKPVANTYKGINALQAKGAVMIDESENRLCRAVPPSEVFEQMKRALGRRCEHAIEALSVLTAPAEDERVYRLTSCEQVMERARQMIRRTEQVVLLSCFPGPLVAIKSELEQAAQRGVGVLLKLYQPETVQGAHIALSSESDFFLHQFPAQELSLVADAREQLQAMLAWQGQTVLQAIWSGSVFLSFNHYNGLYSEWILTKLAAQIQADDPTDNLKQTLARAYPLMQTPGYHKLLESPRRPQRKETP